MAIIPKLLRKTVLAKTLIVSVLALGSVTTANAIPVSPSKYGFWASRIEVRVDNLASLAGGRHYEGWAKVGQTYVSTGKFNISENGKFTDIDGNIMNSRVFAADTLIHRAKEYIITVEQAGDADDLPSTDIMLSGRIKANGVATLRGDKGAGGAVELFVI